LLTGRNVREIGQVIFEDFKACDSADVKE